MAVRRTAVFKPPSSIKGWIFDLNGVLITTDGFLAALPGAVEAAARAVQRYGANIGICTGESWGTVETSLYLLDLNIPRERILWDVTKLEHSAIEGLIDRMKLHPAEVGFIDDGAAGATSALALGCGISVYSLNTDECVRYGNRAAPERAAEWIESRLQRLDQYLLQHQDYVPEQYRRELEMRLVAVDTIRSIEF